MEMEIDELSDTERAYLAGLLDRSCFIGIIRYRTKYTARITVPVSYTHLTLPTNREV